MNIERFKKENRYDTHPSNQYSVYRSWYIDVYGTVPPISFTDFQQICNPLMKTYETECKSLKCIVSDVTTIMINIDRDIQSRERRNLYLLIVINKYHIDYSYVIGRVHPQDEYFNPYEYRISYTSETYLHPHLHSLLSSVREKRTHIQDILEDLVSLTY